MTDYEPKQPIVQTRRRWGAAWQTLDDVYCVRAVAAVAPAIPTAQFRVEYGTLTRGGATADLGPYEDGLRNRFIRVLRRESEETLWLGVVTGQTDTPHNAAITSGDQDLTACGIEHLLARTHITGSYVELAGGADLIERRLAFNGPRRGGGGLTGNRSKRKIGGTYVFSRDGKLWTAADVAEYFVVRFGPPALGLRLAGQVANLAEVAENWPCPRTLHAALRMVIDRRRGAAWFVDFRKNELTVAVRSVLSAAEAGACGLEGNSETIRHAAIDGSETAVRSESGDRYDRIVVRGGHVVVCDTLNLRKSLTGAWSEDLQAEYNSIDLGDAVLNDAARRSEKYRDVYSRFSCRDAEFTTIVPAFGDNGEMKFKAGKMFTPGKGPLAELPLLAGVDYSSGQPVETNKRTAAEREYLAPFAVTRTATQTEDGKAYRYEFIDRPESDPLAEFPTPPAHLHVLPGTFGVRISVADNYRFAEQDFGNATDSVFPPDRDWRTTYATVAWETDVRLRVARDLPARDGNDVPRELVLDVPDAQVHAVAVGTILDLKTDGRWAIAPNTMVIRNDVDRLRSVLRLAAAWYGRKRRAIAYREPVVRAKPAPLGALLDELQVGRTRYSIGALVTSVEYDFERLTTTWRTDFGELDAVGIEAGRRQGAGRPTPGAAAPGRWGGGAQGGGLAPADGMPARVAEHPSVDGRWVRFAILTEDWESGNSVTAHPCNDAGGEVDTDTDLTLYAVTPTGRSTDFVQALKGDVVAYQPFGTDEGVLVDVIHGGTYADPLTLDPASAPGDGDETVYADTWTRSDWDDDDGVEFWMCCRIVYTAAMEMVFVVRRVQVDSAGCIRYVGPEIHEIFNS